MAEQAMIRGEGPRPLSRGSMGQLLEDAANEFPDHVAVNSVWQGKTLDYRSLNKAADTAALALMAHDIAAGDRVGVWSGNRVEWIILQFAVARIGAILVNVNPAYRENELDYTIGHSGCKALFLSPAYRGFDCLAVATRVQAAQPVLQLIVHFESTTLDGALSWPAFLQSAPAGDAALLGLSERAAKVAAQDPVSIQYTSGTTGKPKGATLTHCNLVNNGAQVAARLRLDSTDRVCLPVPLFHCFGMVIGVIGAVAHGSALVLPGETFNAADCIAAIDQHGCTAFYGVPMMFIAILNHAEFSPAKMKTLRTGLMGGAPCPAEILRAAIDQMNMREVAAVYGMTETSPISLQCTPDDTFEQRTHSVGKVHPHVEVKVIDVSNGRVVNRGERGELCVRGYLVMQGYWKNPEATAAAIDPDGWMHTGDLAVVREDGYVAIVGRTKDMLIRGGENIFPREVEEFLHTVPAIAEAQVFGVPDQVYGEQVCAWVRLKPGAVMGADELKAACKGKIASFKIPFHIRFVDEFPTTASGKVQKFRMREIEMAERDLKIEQPTV